VWGRGLNMWVRGGDGDDFGPGVAAVYSTHVRCSPATTVIPHSDHEWAYTVVLRPCVCRYILFRYAS